MEQERNGSTQNWIPALITALLLGAGLHDLFRLWPSIVTEFIAPVNNSIWEHIKVIFWPLLLVEVGFFPKAHRPGGLLAILIVCASMLLSGWIYHVVLGGKALFVDILIYGVCITAYFFLSERIRISRRWLPLLSGVTLLLMVLIFAFTAAPPHGVLFNDPNLADAWVVLPC